MGTSVPAVGVSGGGLAKSAALLTLALVLSLGSRALAAGLTVTSGDSLNVTSATAAVLPMTAASGSVLPMTAPSGSVLPDASGGGAADLALPPPQTRTDGKLVPMSFLLGQQIVHRPPTVPM